MQKERSFIIIILFLLFQIPLVFLFKNHSFEEKKWQMVMSETFLIGCSLCAVLCRKKTPSVMIEKKSPIRAVVQELEKSKEEESFVALKEEYLLLEEQKAMVMKELIAAKERIQYLEKEQEALQKAHERIVEEKEFLSFNKNEHEENVQLLKEMMKKAQRALFAEIESQQEMRRQHMIEVRALLRKDTTPSLKEGNFFPERKSIVSSVPRGTNDSSLLLLLVSAFAEKLKIHHENEQNAQFLVRRKFFEELRAVRPKNLLCLSLETPTENFLSPDTISSEEVQKLIEWIRFRLEKASWEEGGCPVVANPVSGKEKWMVLRLDKPFFHDLFLCANQSKP